MIVNNAQVMGARLDYLRELVAKGLAAGPVVITLGRKRRSLDQNAKLHAAIRDVAKQVEWFGAKRPVEDWKVIFVSALRREQGVQAEVVPGLNGELVPVGYRTSKLSKQDCSDLIEMVHAFGSRHGVEWGDL